MAICWINGRLVDEQQAQVSVFDHGLLYGDGIFEGIRFYKRTAFRLAAHLTRLQQSARAIGITMPYTLSELDVAIDTVIQNYPDADGYIRLMVTRGIGSLGINPKSCQQPTVIIIADKPGFIEPAVLQTGARLIIASTRRLPPDGLDPRVKSLNYLNHILARIEANHANADEAILLNAQGRVSEGTSDNVFIVANGRLLTPPTTDGALAGITRSVVLEVATEIGIECEEKSLAPYDLYTADECFLTGTAVELVPVREIDGRKLTACPGPLFQRLQAAFKSKIEQESIFDSIQSAVS